MGPPPCPPPPLPACGRPLRGHGRRAARPASRPQPGYARQYSSTQLVDPARSPAARLATPAVLLPARLTELLGRSGSLCPHRPPPHYLAAEALLTSPCPLASRLMLWRYGGDRGGARSGRRHSALRGPRDRPDISNLDRDRTVLDWAEASIMALKASRLDEMGATHGMHPEGGRRWGCLSAKKRCHAT
jgi:hypothetical protein